MYMNQYNVFLKNAFKCRGVSPNQERALGMAMLDHESRIDRSYMSLDFKGRWLTLKRPKRVPRTREMMQWIYDVPNGHEFTLKHLLKNSSPTPVYRLAKTLLDAGALCKTSVHLGGAFRPQTYIVSIPNREVLKRMLDHHGR